MYLLFSHTSAPLRTLENTRKPKPEQNASSGSIKTADISDSILVAAMGYGSPASAEAKHNPAFTTPPRIAWMPEKSTRGTEHAGKQHRNIEDWHMRISQKISSSQMAEIQTVP